MPLIDFKMSLRIRSMLRSDARADQRESFPDSLLPWPDRSLWKNLSPPRPVRERLKKSPAQYPRNKPARESAAQGKPPRMACASLRSLARSPRPPPRWHRWWVHRNDQGHQVECEQIFSPSPGVRGCRTNRCLPSWHKSPSNGTKPLPHRSPPSARAILDYQNPIHLSSEPIR